MTNVERCSLLYERAFVENFYNISFLTPDRICLFFFTNLRNDERNNLCISKKEVFKYIPGCLFSVLPSGSKLQAHYAMAASSATNYQDIHLLSKLDVKTLIILSLL
jgi:hypothetical protein